MVRRKFNSKFFPPEKQKLTANGGVNTPNYCPNVPFAEVEQAIRELEKIHPAQVTTDKIKVLCARNRDAMPVVQPNLSKTGKEIVERSAQQLRMYDDMFDTHTPKAKEDVA